MQKSKQQIESLKAEINQMKKRLEKLETIIATLTGEPDTIANYLSMKNPL